ncbi:unnamed protein product [Enterobius vermicularis]|uniref:glucuronosyltransferase n=1 Tax=Enterobius vermicularis TaxID=51028 RepID=A0A0N4V9E3_ENTVE|nr:unnamed protein product [Enterobius vermicularis]
MQLYLFNFGSGPLQIPETWKRIMFDYTSMTEEEMSNADSLMYEMNIPIDFRRLWDMRGLVLATDVVKRYLRSCPKVMLSAEVKELTKRPQSVDLVIVDHFLQECLVLLATNLHTSMVMYSNWPIADGYISSFNVPANPSSVPKTGTTHSGIYMTFRERTLNTLFHLTIIIARILGSVAYIYMSKNYNLTEINFLVAEADIIFYGGRSELIFDTVRPINSRVKYFGCPQCKSKDKFKIKMPKSVVDFSPNWNCTHSNTSYSVPQCTDLRQKKRTNRVSEVAYSALSVYEKRYIETQKEFPKLDFGYLHHNKFALLSFGSVTKLENMPKALVKIFLQTFANLNYTVIWQTNSKPEKLDIGPLPSNVILIKWVPLKVLLGHPNLLYFITHGGINTVNEIIWFGVPIIAIPLQGDQPSNTQRLIELKIGLLLQVDDIWRGQLANVIKDMEDHYTCFKNRAKKISEMAAHYRGFVFHSQKFWLTWASRYGRILKASNRKYFDFKYWTLFEYFDVPQYLIYGPLLILLLTILSVHSG